MSKKRPIRAAFCSYMITGTNTCGDGGSSTNDGDDHAHRDVRTDPRDAQSAHHCALSGRWVQTVRAAPRVGPLDSARSVLQWSPAR